MGSIQGWGSGFGSEFEVDGYSAFLGLVGFLDFLSDGGSLGLPIWNFGVLKNIFLIF